MFFEKLKNYNVLLASGSKRRHELLNQLGVKFKIVKNTNMVINDNELKSNIIEAINKFFDIENWDFGETFYFQELSAYIINSLTPALSSIVIVPKQADQTFGSLFEIKSEANEIFLNAATVNDIEIIDGSVKVPEGHGLGVELNEDVLNECKYEKL